MKRITILLTVLVMLASATAAQASTVLNLLASQYGDALSGFPTLGIYLTKGSYTFSEVEPQTDPRATFVSWSPYASWAIWMSAVWIYEGTPGSETKVGAMGGTGYYSDPQSAFNDPTNKPVVFNVATSQNVYFGVPDNILYDNRGGVSILISQNPTPEPGTWASMGLGVAFLAFRRRKLTPSA